MKRTRTVAGIAIVALSSLSIAPATADPGHEKPRITVFKFLQPPLKAGIDEILKVVAHDPNSWISEIQVQWEDGEGNGGALFAHTGCVQDPDHSDPGTPAKLLLPVNFDHPDTYHVEVRAISEINCEGSNETRISKTLEMDVVAVDPLKTQSDPDDASGAFDISSIEQTQMSSDTSATTEIVHRITTYEAWTTDQLAGPAYMEIYFDLDNDSSTFERVLTIDLDENDSTLRALMLDPATGQGRGYAAVSRLDDKTIEVRIPPLLIKKGLRSYRWYAYADGGAAGLCTEQDPCSDRAPDDSLTRHRL